MWDDILSYTHDIVGGLLASIAYATLTLLVALNRASLLKRTIFPGIGLIKSQPFYIVYAQFTLNGPPANPPYVKLNHRGHPTGYGVLISSPVSKCEVRGATYLTNMLSKVRGLTPVLASDDDMESIKDISVVSLGGLPNLRTTEIYNQLDSGRQSLMNDFLNRHLIPGHHLMPGYDHGVILRFTSPDATNKSTLICAGLGEWGTSGSAWYLATHYAEITRSLRGRFCEFIPMSIPDYIAFIRVRPEDDSSSSMLTLYSINKERRLIQIFPKN